MARTSRISFLIAPLLALSLLAPTSCALDPVEESEGMTTASSEQAILGDLLDPILGDLLNLGDLLDLGGLGNLLGILDSLGGTGVVGDLIPGGGLGGGFPTLPPGFPGLPLPELGDGGLPELPIDPDNLGQVCDLLTGNVGIDTVLATIVALVENAVIEPILGGFLGAVAVDDLLNGGTGIGGLTGVLAPIDCGSVLP
ncbi:hypothetical protein [Haliangium ochraceum]|uniref:Uncharacterized protein n=1 Tax=Haliangium ochraceum (strain DSM 14365 / JCM 11303 / SMP-2) TaxID=502025 RepID=D0LUZ4_HALO1|nr:hypothetical protein [Haliangium ochraceum]ACY15835.1 hypothetical protein Hoch_3333 [Haliangium ochraceum DSM 14365]